LAALVGIDRNFTGRRQRRGTACGFEDWGLDVSRKITRIARIGFDGARPIWVGKKLRFSWSTRRSALGDRQHGNDAQCECEPICLHAVSWGGGLRMPRLIPAWRKVIAQPGRFTLQVLRAFQKNQGLLLSGALAYYILLSVIPLLTLLLLVLSHVVDAAALMATLRRYIGLVIPGDSETILAQIRNILEHREVAGWVVLGTMLFFSSLAFSVLESAMSIIFVHRVRHRPRPLIVSLLLPYLYILLLGAGFLMMTVIASLLQSMSDDQLVLLGRGWPLDRLSVALLYLTGVVGLILVLTSIYLVMPPRGRISPRHALVGGVVVGLLWEVTRHILLWYFSTLSLVGVVYGSLATTIIGLLSLEIASIILLLGAQVIAEYERFQDGDTAPTGELKTEAAR